MFSAYQTYISLYRVYDAAYEVDLDRASEILQGKSPNKLKLRKHTRDMVLSEAPLALSLGELTIKREGEEYSASCFCKIWSYGAISIQLKVNPGQEISLLKLNQLIDWLEESEQVEEIGIEKVKEVSSAIQSALEKPGLSQQVEDYTIIQFVSNGPAEKVEESLKEDFYRLLEGEGVLRLSQQTKDSIRQSTFQYSESDLAVIDWNRALLLGDKNDVEELGDILEFAVSQLLELRYYDDLLDRKIMKLYHSLEGQKPPIWKNRYSKLSEEAALVYIELSEVIDKVGNSLKMVGDTYYAKIFRAAVEKFRINDWKTTVVQKLNNLAQLSELFSNEINERRNQLMELIIIVLIAVEVVPFLYNLFD